MLLSGSVLDRVQTKNDPSNRDFPRPDFGPNIGTFPSKKLAKAVQNGVYHSQFLSSTFW